MSDEEDTSTDLASLDIRQLGSLEATDDPWEPFRLLDPDGATVQPVADYLMDLQAAGRPVTTQRSYGMDLLRWFRFLWAIDVSWNEATRSAARDFARWLQIADKPARSRRPGRDGAANPAPSAGITAERGTPNPVTGKPGPGRKYAPSTRAHSESVLRHFYDFHLEAGTGPMVNPFPLARGRHRGRAGAHHNPMNPHPNAQSGLFRPRLAQRIPRGIPDEQFNRLFAQLVSHRDRALVALWVSTGARASELLSAMRADADPGRQLITVVRKGTRALQQLPASPDAFVWLRLYQVQVDGLVPAGRDEPLWWTLRRPFRALTYHAALGANWTLHDLRHSAAYRMARDPQMPLTDVQWVLGHAHLSTTQLYVTAPVEDVIESVLAHHRRQSEQKTSPPPKEPPLRYRPETLDILFGTHPRW